MFITLDTVQTWQANAERDAYQKRLNEHNQRTRAQYQQATRDAELPAPPPRTEQEALKAMNARNRRFYDVAITGPEPKKSEKPAMHGFVTAR